MKKILLSIFLILFFFSFFTAVAWANASGDKCPSGGLVPCGGPECPCTLCHFFLMLKNIYEFLLFDIIPPLAILMVAIGGFFLIVAYASPIEGGPDMINRAKRIFKAVVFGILISYGAWLIINLFFQVIGVAIWQGPDEGWWKIECDVPSSNLPPTQCITNDECSPGEFCSNGNCITPSWASPQDFVCELSSAPENNPETNCTIPKLACIGNPKKCLKNAEIFCAGKRYVCDPSGNWTELSTKCPKSTLPQGIPSFSCQGFPCTQQAFNKNQCSPPPCFNTSEGCPHNINILCQDLSGKIKKCECAATSTGAQWICVDFTF